MPSPSESFWPRDRDPASLISPLLTGRFFTTSTAWEAHMAIILNINFYICLFHLTLYCKYFCKYSNYSELQLFINDHPLWLKVKKSEKVGLKLNIRKIEIMASGPITSWQIDGDTVRNSGRLYFHRLQNHCRWWLQPWNKKTLTPWKKSYDQPGQYIKKQRRYFANKGPSSQGYGFTSSYVWMWDLDHKEGWTPKN